MKTNKVFFLLIILFLFTISCNENKNDFKVARDRDFYEYFKKIKDIDFITYMNNLEYFGPYRGVGRMEISYLDGTEAWFNPDNYENVNIFKKGSNENISKDMIISDIRKMIILYASMQLNGIERNVNDSIIEISFNLDAIKKESLPEYKHPNKTTEQFYVNEGILVYSYCFDFQNTHAYKNLRHSKIENDWYLAYY